MQPVKIGLVGAGVIGKRHVEALGQIAQGELVAIADPLPAAAEYAASLDVPIYKSAGEMAAKSGAEAIIIATPTERHLEDAMACMQAGVHLLIEKPITATVAEAKQIIAYSTQHNLHVLVGHQRRYYPCALTAKQMIADGTLGQLIGMTGQWNAKKDAPYYEPDWRKDAKAGPVLTNLIHEMDLLRYICGDIVSVSAEVTNHNQNFDKEDAVAISLRFANQAVGTFLLSDRTPSPWTWEFGIGESDRFPKSGHNSIRFLGADAALEFPNLVLWRHDVVPGDWGDVISGTSIATDFIDAYQAQCTHLCAVVRGEEAPKITATDATKSLMATLAVMESAASGQRIDLAQ
ncbi:MAG: Gfo/Idh/MocA family protein [Candidatus Puniceispirillum sp.]